jgi:hypothetical protein
VATAELSVPGYPFFLQEDPASTNQIYYSAKDFRNYTAAFQRRSGVLGSSHFLITQADNVGFKIKLHSGYVNVGGFYIVHLPTDVEILLSGAGWKPNSGTVVHKVFAVVYDEYVAGTDNKATVLVTQDTGSGAPNPSGSAAAYLQLATITVTSTQANIQNANIDNTARHGGSAAEYEPLGPYLRSGFEDAGSAATTANFRALYDSGTVRLGGMIKKTSGAFPSGQDFYIADMHSNLRPSRTRFLTGACTKSTNTGSATGSYTYQLIINPSGIMTARIPSTQAPLNLMFDGITYDLD